MCMHHVYSCIYIVASLPYLKLLTPFIKSLLMYDILSQELHTLLQMVAPGAPPHSDMFLAMLYIREHIYATVYAVRSFNFS